MSWIHRLVGFAVVGVFTVGWVWGLIAWIRRKPPGGWFWRSVAVAQVVVGVQAVLGIVLLLLGRRVVTGGQLSNVLHYVYGLLPLLLFVFAHVVARAGDASIIGFPKSRKIETWVPFAWVSFIGFGLTFRALMTGLGWAV